MRAVAGLVTRAPLAVAGVAVLLTLVAAHEVRSFGAGSLEYDFSKLRRADTWTSGEGYWGGRMDELLGRYLTPTVVLTDTPDEARAVAEALRRAAEAPPLAGFVSAIRTATDVLPTDQARKIAIAREIRRDVTPRIRRELDPDALTIRVAAGVTSRAMVLRHDLIIFSTGISCMGKLLPVSTLRHD